MVKSLRTHLRRRHAAKKRGRVFTEQMQEMSTGCACRCTHTHTRARAHTHEQECVTHTQMYTHRSVKHAHARTRTHTHTRAHTHTHTDRSVSHTHIHKRILRSVKHAHVHTRTHAHTHTHTRTHTHTCWEGGRHARASHGAFARDASGVAPAAPPKGLVVHKHGGTAAVIVALQKERKLAVIVFAPSQLHTHTHKMEKRATMS